MIISDKLSKLILTQAQTNAEMNFNFFFIFIENFQIFIPTFLHSSLKFLQFPAYAESSMLFLRKR